MFYIRDDQDSSYEELWAGDDPLVAAVVKGQAVLINDTFCFYMTAGAIGAFVVPIWRCRQVLADKTEGTGSEIERGERVYYILATGLVTAHPAGVIGVDYYYCGICKQTADADDEQVLMSFWGDEYADADKAA